MTDSAGIFVPAVAALLSAIALMAVRAVAFKLLHRWAGRTETELDDIIIRAFRYPSLFWCVAIGLYIGIAVSGLPEKYVHYSTRAIHVIIVFSITLAASNLGGSLFKNYVKSSNLPIPATGLAYGILKGAILVMGFLIMLSVLGVSITPLITALGVGGLAVALALQDTLANLFAGMHILMEKSIKVGDCIRLESGQEGWVEDITWRTTRVRMRPNNMVVIPNSKLSQSVVTNFSLPERRLAVSVPVSVSYKSDVGEVEKALLDAAHKAMGNVEGLLPDPAPFVNLTGFGESSIDFTLVCQVRDYGDQFFVQSELRKGILRRFHELGIEIPYPHRVVFVKDKQQ